MNNDENQVPSGHVAAVVKSPYSSLNKTKIRNGNSNSGSADAPSSTSDQAQEREFSSNNHQAPKMSILKLLHRDYEELQKESVNACLRSKTFPCPEVTNLLEKQRQLDLSMLQEDLKILFEHEDYLGAMGMSINTHSSLWFMTRLGTAIRFLQLLAFAKLEIQESSQMIAVLLKQLTKRMEQSLKDETSEMSRQPSDEDNEDLLNGQIRHIYHPQQICCFVLAFLTRIKNPLLQERPNILGPFWRSMDAIAVALSPRCPMHLLQSNVGSLLPGLKGILQDCLAIVEQSEKGNNQQLPQQHFKMVLFSFARLESFLRVSSIAEEELDKTLVRDLLCLLLCFRGLIAVAAPHLPANSILLGQFEKCACKAEKCGLSMLLKGSQHDSTRAILWTPHVANLKQLFDLTHTSTAMPLGGLIKDIKDPLGLIQPAITIGKVQILQRELNVGLLSPTAPQGGGVASFLADERSVNVVLAICEHLLFVALPVCFSHVALPCLKKTGNFNPQLALLDMSLHCISDSLYLIETSAPCMTYNASRCGMSLHRLFLRWLMPFSATLSKTDVSPIHHPLARECTISIVHFHIVRLYGEASVKESMPLLELLVQALFDQRALSPYRRTIAALIRDIYASGSQGLKAALQQLVCAGYASRRLHSRKKRKRGNEKRNGGQDKSIRAWYCYTFEDLQVIGSVLAMVPFSVVPNLAADVENFCLRFLDVQSDIKKRRTRLKRDDVCNAILVLRLLGAAVRENPGASFFQDLSNEGLRVPSLQHEICTWFLKQWNTEFENGKRKHIDQKRMNHLSVMGSAVLGFLACSGSSGRLLADFDFVKSFCGVLDVCSNDYLLKRIGDGTNSLPRAPLSNQASLEHLVLEVTRGLGFLCGVCQPSAFQGILDRFLNIFGRLFRGNCCWSVGALTTGSFLGLLKVLAPSQHTRLQTCLPKHLKKGIAGLVQCRLSGKVYRYQKHESGGLKRTRAKAVELLQHCSRELEALVCPLPLSAQAASMFDDTASDFPTNPVPLEVGSYFLKMATQEGRHAIVVFPPGETSLADINLMMGDRENTSEIRQLRRVTVAQDGSCLAYL